MLTRGTSLDSGSYDISVTVFEGKQGKGKVLERLSFEIDVDDEAPVIAPTPDPEYGIEYAPETLESILDIKMVYTDTQEMLATIDSTTMLIDASKFDGREIGI